MEAAAGLIKLSPNTGELVGEWRDTLEATRVEALQNLRDEGVSVESWFQVEIAGELYLLWYMRAESVRTVREFAGRSKHDVDAYHFEIMSKTTQSQMEAILLLDMSTGGSDT